MFVRWSDKAAGENGTWTVSPHGCRKYFAGTALEYLFRVALRVHTAYSQLLLPGRQLLALSLMVPAIACLCRVAHVRDRELHRPDRIRIPNWLLARRSQHGLAGRVRARAAQLRSSVCPPFAQSLLRQFCSRGDDDGDAAPVLNLFASVD
jgi:hypothetical protein